MDPFANSLDRLKESFLWAAAQGGNFQDCESLLEIGAEVEWKSSDGDTPLLAAARRGHASTVGLLLAHGANANAVGADSFSALHIACKRGDAGMLSLLLDANIDTNLRTSDGQTARDLAEVGLHMNIVDRLDHQAEYAATTSPLRIVSPTSASAGVGSGSQRGGGGFNSSSNNGGTSTGTAGAGGLPSNLTRKIRQQLERVNSTAAAAGAGAGGSLGSPNGSSQSSSSPRSNSGAFSHGLNSPTGLIGSVSLGQLGDGIAAQAEGEAAELSYQLQRPANMASGKASSGKGAGIPPSSVSGSASATSAQSSGGGGGGGNSSARSKGTSGDGVVHDDDNCPFIRQLELERKDKKAFELRLTYMNEELSYMKREVEDLHRQKGELITSVDTMQLQMCNMQEEHDKHVQQVQSAASQRINYLTAQHAAEKARGAAAAAAAGTGTGTGSSSGAGATAGGKDSPSPSVGGETDVSKLNSIEECDQVEKTLRNRIEALDKRREQLIKNKTESAKEQRLCIVCCEKEKSVVLMPCRHMCLCEDCGAIERITQCPLCRKGIVHKISVYS